MRIELTFPDQSRETTDLKSGTGTSSVTSPIWIPHVVRNIYLYEDYTLEGPVSQLDFIWF